ncbi:hypothetical protein D3C81_511370 [compost metagenome]
MTGGFMKSRLTITMFLFSLVIAVIIFVHLIFYLIARLQAGYYIDHKYQEMNLKIGWPSQTIINNIVDGWYTVPVYTTSNGMKLKFTVSLNMYSGSRDDDFLLSAMSADAERQFAQNVQEIIPNATVYGMNYYFDEEDYFEKYGAQNIQYVHNDSSNGYIHSIIIEWAEKSALSDIEFLTKCENAGQHFVGEFPLKEITFIYKYGENEETRTYIRSSNDKNMNPKDIDIEVLRKNLFVVEH